ncbi:Rv1733c family protein [Streptomyces sp. NPDC054797]
MFEAHSEEGLPRRPLGRRSNELRRAADRTRGRWLAAFRFSPLLAVLCGIAIGMAVWSAESRAAEAQALHRHRVGATTVGPADRALPVRFNSRQMATAQAVWEYPASHRHTDTVLVPAGTPVGGKVTVWVDDAGTEALEPRSDDEVTSTAVAAGAAAFGIVVLSAGLVVWLRLRRVETRSLAAWDGEWERFEPRWSGRLRREPGAEDD